MDMIFRLFFKVLRLIVIAIIVALLIFCVLFAVMQSKWAKEQVKDRIASYLQDAGISATITELDGQPPFTWTIKEADLQLGADRSLKLSNVKFRFAILPLLKGRVAINYLKVENAEYAFHFATEASEPLSIQEGKTMLRQQLEDTVLPCQVTLNHFAIERMTLINKDSGSTLTFGMAGKAKIRQDIREFVLDLTLFSPDKNRTYLEAALNGSKEKDFIETKLKINLDSIPAFLSLGLDGNIAAEFNVKGPWTTWNEILYDLPRTKDPLTGLVKGMIGDTHVQSAPILNRNWKFKAQFSLASSDVANIQNFLLLSDLIHVKGKAELHSDLEKSKALIAFSMPDLSHLSPLASFPVSGSAHGKAFYQEGSFKASFDTQALTLEKFAAGTTRTFIKGSVEAGEWEAEVKLQSADAAIPFESSFAVEFVPQTFFSIIDFHLSATDLSLYGFLYYDFADHLWDGSLKANVEHLDRFGIYLKEESLNGGFSAELNLSAWEDEQNASCAIVARNMRYRDILLDDLTMSAEIENLFKRPEGKLNLLAQKVYTPGFYLDRLNFGTRSDEANWPFYIDTTGRVESPFQCYAKGFWQKENPLFTLELTQLSGELSDIPFSLDYPFELEWGADYLNLSPFDFRIGDGHFYSTFELSPVRSVGKWELEHFPLEILSCFRPRFALNGYVTTSGFIDATPDNIEGALRAVIEEAGVLHYGKKEPFQAKGSIQVHLNQSICQVHTDLHATDEQVLDFNATLPIEYSLFPFKISFDKAKNTSAELVAEGKLQDLFDFVNMGTNHFTGLLSCRLFLSQTLAFPSLQGQLELQNGTYENYFTGIDLRNIDAQFEAHNDEIHLVSMNAGDDKSGEVTAAGKIYLKPDKHFPYSFEAEMRKLHALGFDMIDCDLTGPLYLTGDTQNMFAQGNLLIDEAKIQITERLPYEVSSLPVTYVNRPPHLVSRTVSSGPGFAFHIDLELTSEGHVLVKGRGLNAELEGNVHLYGTNTNIAANGSLKLITGEYVFSGKVFKLTEGEIVFNDKPTPSAYLNINGTLSLPDITITAMMRGPLTSPQLTFQSNPQKPTSSILALILFNKDITEISHPEAIQLASTLVSLSGGAGPDVLESIRKSIGIDRLNIASKPGSDELAVQIGKYLTRGIMITLSQSATSSQVIVEVELPKGFVFQAETQEEEEGKFSLKWRKSY
ncbi:MAG: translocation/assembly module TamB domain-containing protein [Verrucomicrobia bacterium]|nr:translocation/assembly module TamB domain-containing protein [Verrucomicrobiota bacterium]